MVSPYVKDKFDLGILRQDGTTKVGLMLAKDKTGKPIYSLVSKKKLTDSIYTGLPDYGYQDPEEELPIQQDDWRSGLGLEIADSNDKKRYHKSTMDMRFRNMGIAGTLPASITAPTPAVTSPLFTNMEFELTTGWSANGRTALNIKKGSYHWRLTGAQENYQDSSTWSNDWRGKTVTFVCWMAGSIAPGAVTGAIGIDDGIGNTYATLGTFDGTYYLVTVSRLLDASATRLRLLIRASTNGNTDFDWAYVVSSDAVFGGTIKKGIDYNDLHYIPVGCSLYKLDATAAALTLVKSFHTEITSLEVFSDNKLYIALGLDESYWEMTTAEAFTRNTLASNYAKYFKFVRTTADTMYESDSVNTIRSTTNPADGGTAWSGTTTVDTSYNEITGLFTDAGALYINKEDIPYYLSSAGAVQNDLAPELAALSKSTSNGKNATFWLHKFYLPWGEQALLEYDSGVNTWRSPALSCTNAAEYNGQVFAVAGDDQYLYAILNYGTKIEVMAGRLESIDSVTEFPWHCIAEITLTGCQTCWITSFYQKRLWISSTTASEALYYIPLYIGYADVVSDTNRSFQTGSTMETSWLHGNFKATNKAFPSLTLTMGHTYNANRYFTVKYKKLGDSSWTTIGNYTGSATSMIQTKYIPVDASSNNPVSTMFKLQFTAVTNDTTITPVLYSFLLSSIVRAGQRDIIACSVVCANEITLRDGSQDKGSQPTIIATLDEARAATWPVTIYDIEGTSTTVNFLPVNPLFTLVYDEKGRVKEYQYNLLMEKVTLS